MGVFWVYFFRLEVFEMETDKDCINCEDGQLDDDSLALVWGGSKPIIKWIGKEIARAAIAEAVSSAVQGLLNPPLLPQ